MSDRRSYEDVVEEAASSLRETEDLSPQQWSRIRDGVETESGTRSWFALGWGGAIAVTVVVLLTVTGVGFESQESPEAPEAPVALLAHERTAPPVSDVATTETERQEKATPVEGDRLVASDVETRWSAFERHELRMSEGSELLVKRWETGAMDLLLLEGSVTAQVDKLKPGERFEIRTRDVVVRVVGTLFTVKLMPSGGTEVSVDEGVVEVTPRTGAVARLEVGDRRHFADTSDSETQSAEEPPGVPLSAERRRRAAPVEAADDSLKVIEIDVPPQSAPVPERMRDEGQTP